MKRHLLFIVLVFIASTTMVLGQTNMQKVYQTPTLHWYGIDYSQTRFIGSDGFTEPERMVNHYFEAWNEVINTEAEKYSFEEFLLKDNIERHTDQVTAQNQTVTNIEERIIDEDFTLTQEQVIDILSNYTYKQTDGIALHLVMESLSKSATKATAYWVFVDPATRTIVHMEKMEGKAGGFGFRNYWIRPIMEMLEAMDKTYKKTKKEVKKSK